MTKNPSNQKNFFFLGGGHGGGGGGGSFNTNKMSNTQVKGTEVTQSLKSRKENPQELTQLSSRSHPRHLVGKRTAQKDITIDTTSDS